MKLTQYLNSFVMLTPENTRLTEGNKKHCKPAIHTGNARNIKPGMNDTERFIAVTEREMEYLFRIIDSSNSITQRHRFFLWAQDDVQNLLCKFLHVKSRHMRRIAPSKVCRERGRAHITGTKALYFASLFDDSGEQHDHDIA
jgi:hypothetical protein